jgi:hypothetical protein
VIDDETSESNTSNERRWMVEHVGVGATIAIWVGLLGYGLLVGVSNNEEGAGFGFAIFAMFFAGVLIAIPLTGLVWLAVAVRILVERRRV